MILFSEVEQVLQQPFVKQNIPKSSVHLLPDTYWATDIYILSRYTLLATRPTRGVLFEGGFAGIL